MYTTEFTSLRPKNTTSLSTVDPGSYTYISIVKIHVIAKKSQSKDIKI